MSKKISVLIPEYLHWLEYKKLSTKVSVESARKTLNLVVRETNDIRITKLSHKTLDALRYAIISRGNSPAYLRKILITIRSLFNYCKEKKIKTIDSKTIDLPKSRYRLEYFTQDELQTIIEKIDTTTISGLRLYALTLLLLDTGLRISEALSLNRDSINYKSKQVWVMGKGNKKGLVFFHEWSLQALKQYLETRKDTDMALFTSNNGKVKRLTSNMVEKCYIKLSKKTGLKIYPHKFRKTAATLFMSNGGNLHHIQQFLRHSNLKTTEAYIGIDYDVIKRAHQKYVDYAFLAVDNRV